MSSENTDIPLKKPFLTGEWKKLAIANYKIDPAILQPYLPAGTEFNLYNNNCYISLVGFLFLNTKIKGIRIPFHGKFVEINLRFYVQRFDGKENRRGVTFIKEIVSKPMVTIIANSVYKEKYETMKTDHHIKTENTELNVEYSWKKNSRNSFGIIASGISEPLQAGSKEEFITEQNWGYTKVNENKTIEYEVTHPRWNIYPVKQSEIKVDFKNVYGKEFAFLSNTNPESVMLAEGSDIKLYPGKFLKL